MVLFRCVTCYLVWHTFLAVDQKSVFLTETCTIPCATSASSMNGSEYIQCVYSLIDHFSHSFSNDNDTTAVHTYSFKSKPLPLKKWNDRTEGMQKEVFIS